MKLIKCTLCFLFCIISCYAHAQKEKYTLEGTMIDSLQQLTVGDAIIKLIRGYTVVQTVKVDSLGNYRIDSLKEGTHELEILKKGYEPIRRLVNVDSETKAVDFYLQPKFFDFHPTEIVSNKDDEFTGVCSNVSVLSHEEIELRNAISVQQALESVPGIVSFSDGGMGYSRINIGIRGLHPRQSQQVLLMEDGMPIQASPYLMSGGTFYVTPVERIKSIEVLKSASALRYGAQGLGGAINFITQTPRESLGGKFRLLGGANGFISAYTEVGGFGDQKWRPEFQFLFRRGDGYRDNDDFWQLNGSMRIAYIPTRKNRLDIKIHGNFERANASYTGLTEYLFRSNPRFNGKEDDRLINGSIGANVAYKHEIAPNVDSETRFYFNYTDFTWWQEDNIYMSEADYMINFFKEKTIDQAYGVEDLVRAGNNQSNTGVLQYFYTTGIEQSFIWDHKIGEKSSGKFNVGIRFHSENIDQQERVGDAPDDYVGRLYEPDTSIQVGNHYQWENYAFSIFAMEQFQFGKFSLNLGCRLEAFNVEQLDLLSINRERQSKAFVTVLPGIGFNYDFKSVDIFGGAHRSFSPPSMSLLRMTNFGSTSNTIYQDLTSLMSDSWNFELGARAFTPYVDIEATAFLLLMDNLSTAGHRVSFINETQAISTGIETSLNFKASQLYKHLPNIRINYTYLRTSILKGNLSRSALALNTTPDLTGNELPYAPRHTFAIAATYHSEIGLSAFVEYRYVGRAYSDFENINFTFNRGDTGPIPAYWLLNASISYQYKHFLRFFVTGENLLDKVYISSRLSSHPGFPSATSSTGILVGNRLSIVGGVEYKF